MSTAIIREKKLKKHFVERFSDIDRIESDILLFQKPFDCNLDNVPVELQLELIDLQANDLLKEKHREGKLVEFYRCLSDVEFPKLRKFAAVGDEVISSIGRGLCVFIGISRYDTAKEAEYIKRKILNLRLFDDENGKRWMKNVVEKDFEILCVSQFTLNVTLKGNKPDFHEAMGPDLSEQFYNQILEQLRAAYKPEKIKALPTFVADILEFLVKTKMLGTVYGSSQDLTFGTSMHVIAELSRKDYGKFGAYMQVQIQNDGPVTIPLEAVPVTPQYKNNKQNDDNTASSL